MQGLQVLLRLDRAHVRGRGYLGVHICMTAYMQGRDSAEYRYQVWPAPRELRRNEVESVA